MSGLGRLFGGRRRREAEAEPASGTDAGLLAQPDIGAELTGRPRASSLEGGGLEGERLQAERVAQLAALPLWTDSHCHLQSSDDVEDVLERSRETGARRMVFVGTDETTSREAAAAAVRLTGSGAPPVEVWSTVGLHPHDASMGVGGVGRFLRELSASGLASSRVVAVGECGLDYHYDHSPRAMQREAFAAQIGFAQQYSLALVIHTREAWDDTFTILDREGLPPRLVFHCFTGGPEEAQACLKRGAYLSFSGIVTFTSAAAVRAAAAVCPLDRLLVETDSPFLTPVPHRGKPNEPSYVPLVGAEIAALKGLEDAAVAQASTSNAAVVFDLHG
jgi:TatD DNase family protein